jgi:FkbM family methyltransferase
LIGDLEFHENKKIEGEDFLGLWWLEGDSGSWEGPSNDWLSHREKIFPRVKKFDVVVQAGGNLGLYPKMLAKRFKRVYTFEPHPKSFRCLVQNVLSDFNVYPINAALAQQHQLCRIQDENIHHNMGMSRTQFGERDSFIPTLLIDDLALDACDLIWLDIEGSEPGAIEGARHTIEQFKPVIVLETTNKWTDNFLEEFGYKHVDRSIADSVFAHSG